MRKVALLVLGSLMLNTSAFAETKTLEWYQQKLQEHGMEPLFEMEIPAIEGAIKAGQSQINILVNRPFETYKQQNESNGLKIKQLILGSGPKHANRDPFNLAASYTVDIEPTANPDLLGSINDPNAMNHLPDESFDHIEWENVSCDAVLNTESFYQVHRILKKGGTAGLRLPIACARTLPLLIQETAFKGKIDAAYGKGIAFTETPEKTIVNQTGHDFINQNKDHYTFTK